MINPKIIPSAFRVPLFEGSTRFTVPGLFQGIVVSIIAVTMTIPAYSQSEAARIAPMLIGLDHIPVAVADLDRAAQRYRDLGFVLKPGRPHANGIRNQHVKFPDGTEIELISVSDNRDTLSSQYLKHLALGDGPAYVGFFVRDLDSLARRFEKESRLFCREGGLITFPEDDASRPFFFGSRNHSPTDLPEHFLHSNGAEALIRVWIASDDNDREIRLFTSLGANLSEREVEVPDPLTVPVAQLEQAEVLFLPAAYQLVPGRPIVGMTLRTRDLDLVRRTLGKSFQDSPNEMLTITESTNGQSLFIPPRFTHGVWLEFRQAN